MDCSSVGREPTINAGRVGPAAPIAAAGAAAASADHPARRAPVREVFITPGSSPRRRADAVAPTSLLRRRSDSLG